MSRSRKPVVYATPRVLRQAQDLGFPGVLESATEAAIAEGRQFRRLAAGARLVDVGGWVVRVVTGDRTPQGSRRLIATKIERRAPMETNERRRDER